MPFSRREFFKQSSGVAGWIALLPSIQRSAQEQIQEPLASGETDLAEFWRQSFSPPSEVRRGESTPAPGSEVDFVHFGNKDKGPQYVQDIGEEDLSPLKGDVVLELTPGRFRAGSAVSGNAVTDFANSAQLRIDIRQTKSFLGVLPKLAWASAAAISLDKTGKLPSTQGLNFTTVAGEDAVTKVLLTGGSGALQLNLVVTKKPSPFLKALQELATVAEDAVPVLGLPAISIAALKGFSLVCGELEGRGKFLMSMRQPQEFAVTQDSWSARSAKATLFPPGDYLAYPTAQKIILQPEFHDLAIEGGYLINSKLDKSLSIRDRADQTAKGLTYLTMRTNLSAVSPAASEKATDQGDSTKPKNH
jgi:hypothetical protein